MDDFLDPHRRTVVVPETSQVYMMQAPRYRGHWFGDGQRRAAPPLVRRHACLGWHPTRPRLFRDSTIPVRKP